MPDEDTEKKRRFTVEVDGQGATGAQGVQGEAGVAGAAGSAGEAGETGRTGAQGEAGLRGRTGEDASGEVLLGIARGFKMLVAATAVVFVVALGGAGYTYITAKQNTDSLCALRTDLESRVKTSQGFLKKHPKGVAGIDAATIKTSVESQKRSIAALSGLNCDE